MFALPMAARRLLALSRQITTAPAAGTPPQALRDVTLTQLVETTKEACDVMAPMINDFYSSINDDTRKLKADKSVFTIADGIVQHLLTEHLFASDKFRGVVGEEDAVVNITTRPYTVDDLSVPERFYDRIDTARKAIAALAGNIDGQAYRTNTIFVDPIDGTREFSTGKGEQCTILVGVADKDGNSVAGVIYRPISAPPIWAVGCKSEDCKRTNISPPRAGAPREPQLVTTNGSISKFTDELIARGMARVKSGGCGNKSLLLLEGKGSAYIQDRGVSRWDTCAPEAVLAAFGGMLLKLNHVLAHPDSLTRLDHLPKESRYCYLETTTNLDFVPGEASLSPYNAHDAALAKKAADTPAADVTQVKAYANLAGLVALPRTEPAQLRVISTAMLGASKAAAPSFT